MQTGSLEACMQYICRYAIIIGNSVQDIEDVCSKYGCSKVGLKDAYNTCS